MRMTSSTTWAHQQSKLCQEQLLHYLYNMGGQCYGSVVVKCSQKSRVGHYDSLEVQAQVENVLQHSTTWLTTKSWVNHFE